MIGGNVPTHLIVGARTGFLESLKQPDMPWTQVANVLDMGAKSVDLVDLGAAPMPVKSKGGGQAQDFIEKNLTVKPEDWEITVFISYNAVQDDQTNTLNNRVRGAGTNFQKHLNKLVFQTLNGGDGTTYGLCYDGQYFFDTDHKDKGAAYQTNQANVAATTLSLDNFNTANINAQLILDDQGEYSNYTYDLLIIPPALERTAAQITGNPEDYTTGNRAINPFSGKKRYVVSPDMDSTAWVLAASSEPIKPLIVAMREQPNLQEAWFDPKAADGGHYYFKFYARYNVYYGNWRLAYMGNT